MASAPASIARSPHAVSNATHIPVIASGGAGKPEDFTEVFAEPAKPMPRSPPLSSTMAITR